jgi:hypothetical protein
MCGKRQQVVGRSPGSTLAATAASRPCLPQTILHQGPWLYSTTGQAQASLCSPHCASRLARM